MATAPAAPPSAGPVMKPEESKAPRLTSRQLACLELLSDGRARKATTKTDPATDEVNGTTASSLVPYGYVEGQAVPGHTLYKITSKGLEHLRSLKDKQQMLQAKRTEKAQQGDGQGGGPPTSR